MVWPELQVVHHGPGLYCPQRFPKFLNVVEHILLLLVVPLQFLMISFCIYLCVKIKIFSLIASGHELTFTLYTIVISFSVG